MPRNLSLLARQMSVTSILAIGMVLVIVAGQIDLSVGALAGLMGALSAMAYTNRDWPLSAAFLLVLVLGAALGAVQGSLVAWLKIPPFIVTLGGMLVFQGALLGVTGGVSTSPGRSYVFIGQRYVPAAAGLGAGGRGRGLVPLPRLSRDGPEAPAVGGLRRARPGRHRRDERLRGHPHAGAARAGAGRLFRRAPRSTRASAATCTRSAATARRRSTRGSPSSGTSSASSP